MYHIPNGKRAAETAALIGDALVCLLQKKSLSSLTKSEVIRQATVSRSTFYRMFYSLEDIMDYLCDRLVSEYLRSFIQTRQGQEPKDLDLYLFALRYWLANSSVINLLVENGLEEKLYLSLRRNCGIFFSQYVPDVDLNAEDIDLFLSMKMGGLSQSIITWCRLGEHRPVEETARQLSHYIEIFNQLGFFS